MLENGLEGVLERIPSDLRASFWARSHRLIRSHRRNEKVWSVGHQTSRIDPKKTRALRNPERRPGRADQEADNPRRVRQSVRRAEMRPATRTCCTRREWSRALRRLDDRTAVGQRDREIASSACASEDQRARRPTSPRSSAPADVTRNDGRPHPALAPLRLSSHLLREDEYRAE